MTFEEFVANPYEQSSFELGVTFAILMMALIVGAVWNSVDAFEDSNDRSALKSLIRAAVCVLGLIGACVVVFNIANAGYAVDHQNEKIAENNLKQKYDIVGVLWDETMTSAQTYDSLGEITVQDNDSNIIKFRYKVDKETREPYLLTDSENAQVKANDLLRNKTEK